MRYPFTDVVMYTAPLAIAVVAWLSATVINVSCGSVACKVRLTAEVLPQGSIPPEK